MKENFRLFSAGFETGYPTARHQQPGGPMASIPGAT